MTLIQCEVTYKCSDTCASEQDGGIRWHGAGIDWPMLAGTMPELSLTGQVQPALADFDSPFTFYGYLLEPLA